MLQRTVKPEHVTGIMRKATMLALQGNLSAARFVIDRVCGRVPEAAGEGVELELALPKLDTVASCTAALDRITAAICDGTVDRDAAKLLLDVINSRLKAIEVNDLEQRLTELEQAASTVDLGGRNLRRL